MYASTEFCLINCQIRFCVRAIHLNEIIIALYPQMNLNYISDGKLRLDVFNNDKLFFRI